MSLIKATAIILLSLLALGCFQLITACIAININKFFGVNEDASMFIGMIINFILFITIVIERDKKGETNE